VGADSLLGAYANGFVTAKSGSGDYRSDLTPEQYWECHAKKWVEGIGAHRSIVGGCCGIFPAHIAHVRKQIDQIKQQK